jgi:hypothetical protein
LRTRRGVFLQAILAVDPECSDFGDIPGQAMDVSRDVIQNPVNVNIGSGDDPNH